MNLTQLIETAFLRRCLAGLILVTSSTAAASAAETWHDVQFGGFISQGYLKSSANDYLGNTSDGTFDFREYALNASYAKGVWRIGAQVFGQKLGEYGDDKIKLDWAMIDYHPYQWLGFRAGRVKLPRGLYNEALDLDSVRPFILLPQSIYDNRLRDFIASFDGAMAYGNVDLKRFGSLDYTLYYGDTPMSAKSGASDFFNTDSPFPNITIGINSLTGGTLFWNTPVTGLRAGYSETTFKNLDVLRQVVVPAAHLDKPYFKNAETYYHHQLSVEYTRGEWVFAAEAAREYTRYKIGVPGVSTTQSATLHVDYDSDLFYVSAARRITPWLELGSYCSVSREHFRHNTNVSIPPLLKQTDYALSARFDLNDHVVFKLEGHYLDGAGKVFNTPAHPADLSSLDTSWTMLAAKVTFSF
jgi:hypothetical protein